MGKSPNKPHLLGSLPWRAAYIAASKLVWGSAVALVIESKAAWNPRCTCSTSQSPSHTCLLRIPSGNIALLVHVLPSRACTCKLLAELQQKKIKSLMLYDAWQVCQRDGHWEQKILFYLSITVGPARPAIRPLLLRSETHASSCPCVNCLCFTHAALA